MPVRDYRCPVPQRCVAAAALVLLSACASTRYPVNPPLPPGGVVAPYDVPQRINVDAASELFVSVHLSGGGTRAAALAAGVFEAMESVKLGTEGQRTLLDETDVVAAVSGGSIAAAYYGLHGKRFFEDFPERVLYQDLQALLWQEFLSPAMLWRLSSPQYGRIEVVASVYDRQIFKGATFGDFRSRGPAILIGATELSGGHRFEFRQSTFDALCSDLNAFPVARAVAASSAVPLLFSPMTLVSHWDRCPDPRPDRSALPSWLWAPYIHLLDGGLSDNISSRGPLEFVEQQGGIVSAATSRGVERVRLLIFIVVNAETRSERSEDVSPDVPGPWRTLQALIDIPINRYSGETVRRLREKAASWQAELREAARLPGSGFAADVEVRVIEVNLRDAITIAGGDELVSAPTSLALPRDLVDRIRKYGFERFLSHPDSQAAISLAQEVLASPR